MPIVNIVDRREREYRFRKINVVVEAAWHDNSCTDSDRVKERGGPDYEERENISLADAILWASGFQTSVTLFLYDEGSGITRRRLSMGTKSNPGTFDCYAKAEEDEPMFVLLARDLNAPYAVEHWAIRRTAEIQVGSKPPSDMAMVEEALQLATEMRAWRRARRREKLEKEAEA